MAILRRKQRKCAAVMHTPYSVTSLLLMCSKFGVDVILRPTFRCCQPFPRIYIVTPNPSSLQPVDKGLCLQLPPNLFPCHEVYHRFPRVYALITMTKKVFKRRYVDSFLQEGFFAVLARARVVVTCYDLRCSAVNDPPSHIQSLTICMPIVRWGGT
jgi:hypothetical protein